jgi:adenylylsulfate kinase-like enzyme
MYCMGKDFSVLLHLFISPYRAERELARSRFEPDEFVEIYIDVSLEECERCDPKGLCAKVAAESW